MAELTEEQVEVVAEALPEFTEAMVGISKGFAALTATLTGAAGALIGFYAAYKKLDKRYAERAEAEIEQMRTHFRQQMIAREEKPDIQELGKKVAELRYKPVENDGSNQDETPSGPGELNTPDVPAAVHNVFEQQETEDGWNYELEKAKRSVDEPYVIHYDERHECEYEEMTLTYYAGDDVLCDAQDKVVDDQDMVVGLHNLDRFGHGSNDPNVVYVRNDKLGIDLEVVRSENTYAEEVHGFKHADSPPRRRRERLED